MSDTAAVAQVAQAVSGGGGSAFLALVTEAVTLLKTGGPFAVAAMAGWWGWKKDREKNDVQEQAISAAKASYDQMVSLVSAQTAAMVKMEATIGALKDVISSLERTLPRG